jgi:hypothetical protein
LTQIIFGGKHDPSQPKEDAVKAQFEIRKWADKDGRKLGWISSQIPVAQATMSRWMKGHQVPSFHYRLRLSEITGIDMLRDENNWVKLEDLA